jgi:hypothetical protein
MQYAVMIDTGRMWGPFKTAEAATKWADRSLGRAVNWVVKPLLDPKRK